jgi:WXG100 family type VII secretion target
MTAPLLQTQAAELPFPSTGAGISSFRVTPADITAAAHTCEATAQEIYAQIQVLRAYVMELETEWGGIAAQTFNVLMADFDTYSNLLNQALQGISNGLNGNWANYTSSEETNIANLQKVHGSLPGSPGARY